MKDYQQRVVDEKIELDEKLTKLIAFILSPAFENVDGLERSRLLQQRDIMNALSSILGERIAAF